MEFPLDNRRLNQEENTRRNASGHNIKAGNAATIGTATLISMIGMLLAKLTGFMRELLIVPKFGYGLFSDAYVNAFQIPDLIYELLVGGAVAAVLTPHLSSGIERGRERSVWRSVSIFISVALVATTIALLLAELLAHPLMAMITGNMGKDISPDMQKMVNLSVSSMRILLLQTLLMTGIAMCHGILSSYKRFTPIAFGPSIYNVFYMLALIFFGAESEAGIRRVSWGVVLASLIYFIFQSFAARRELVKYYRFSLDTRDPAFKKLLAMAVPTLLSGSVLHINSIIMNLFANNLETAGAITSIRHCITTWSLPYAIFAVSIGNVMLPNLSGFIASREDKKVRSLYTSSLRRALFYVTPFALGFFFFNFETIQAIFQWNAETYTDAQVHATGNVLKWFCISMLAHTVVFITNQAFYARKITRLALFTGLVALMINPLFLTLYVNVLGMGMEGIGMAHATYSVLTATFLYRLYVKHRPSQRPYRMFPFFTRLFFCGLTTSLMLFGLRQLPLYPSNKILQLALYAVKMLLCLYTFYVSALSIQMREAVKLQVQIRRTLGLKPV